MLPVIDIIGHLSNAILAFGSAFTNVVYFRIALVSGAVLEIMYNAQVSEVPLWTPIFWSAALISINMFQVVNLLFKKQFLKLTGDELKVYAMVGNEMDLIKFKTLIRSADWQSLPAGATIITENVESGSLFLIVEGEAVVSLNTKQLSVIRTGTFVGEMSFFTGAVPSTTVVMESDSKILSWDKVQLKALLEKEDGIKREVHSMLCNCLVSKLSNQNQLWFAAEVDAQILSHTPNELDPLTMRSGPFDAKISQ